MNLTPLLPIGFVPSSAGPPNQAGLVVWFDGFDINLADNVGIANDDPIGTWKNKGAGGDTYDVVQATAGLKPLFKSSYINGHPAVLSDATDDVLVGTASPVALQAARHIFAVIVVPLNMAGTHGYYCPRGVASGSYALRISNATAAVETNFVDTDNNIPAVTLAGTLAIVEMSFDGVTTNNPTFVINGVAKTVTNGVGTGVGGETAAAGLRIGEGFGEAVGEILSYSAVQSAGDVTLARAYLSAKWGISA